MNFETLLSMGKLMISSRRRMSRVSLTLTKLIKVFFKKPRYSCNFIMKDYPGNFNTPYFFQHLPTHLSAQRIYIMLSVLCMFSEIVIIIIIIMIIITIIQIYEFAWLCKHQTRNCISEVLLFPFHHEFYSGQQHGNLDNHRFQETQLLGILILTQEK